MKWCFTVAREYGVSSSDLLSFLGLGGSDSAPVVLPRMWDASAVYEKRKPLLRELADWISFLGNSYLCCSCSHRNILHLLSLQLLRVNSITSRSSSFLSFFIPALSFFSYPSYRPPPSSPPPPHLLFPPSPPLSSLAPFPLLPSSPVPLPPSSPSIPLPFLPLHLPAW